VSFISFLWQRPSVRFLVALNLLIHIWAFAEDLREARTRTAAIGAVCESLASFSSPQDNNSSWVANSRATATNTLETPAGALGSLTEPFQLSKTAIIHRLGASFSIPKYVNASLWSRGPPAQ